MKRILAVFDRDTKTAEDITEVLREMHGYDVLPAMLSESMADAQIPHVADVVRKCREQGTKLDGVLLHDQSVPADNRGMKQAHMRWQAARERLGTFDAEAEQCKPGVQAVGNDPVEVSVRQMNLEGIVDRAHNEGIAQEKADLERRKGVLEGLLLRNAPSENGLQLIRELRKGPYKSVPIVVGMAHEGKRQAFMDAGATRVITTFVDAAGIMAMKEELDTPGPPASRGKPFECP